MVIVGVVGVVVEEVVVEIEMGHLGGGAVDY